jgi:hypothetical protein
MKQMLTKIGRYTLVFISLMFLTGLVTTPAKAVQDNTTQDNQVFICVDPGDSDTVSPPYLITFRDTDMFGLIVPENGEITAYTASKTGLVAATFTIEPDLQTGGYKRIKDIGKSNATSTLPGKGPCSDNYPEIKDLPRTDALEVSPDHAFVIQLGDGNRLASLVFNGIFSFHFESENVNFGKDFHILQLSDLSTIELSFPFLSRSENTTTRFVLIANKGIDVKRSFEDDNNDFSSACPSDQRSLFKKVLQSNDLSLSKIMSEGKVRISPQRGLIADYPKNGFLQLVMGTGRPLETRFQVGDIITPIDGAGFDYAIPDKPNERVGALATAKIIRIDERSGHLIVQYNDGSEVVVMQPWLVEVVSEPT